MARLAAGRPPAPLPARGIRVVVDARPMQEPERSPLTAAYLAELLGAFARNPLGGESFVIVSRALRGDPSDGLVGDGLPVVGRRVLPPTARALRSAGLTLDSFLLRAAEIGTGTDADGEAVFHTAGGAVPVASRLPVVATLLDLAPWELPQIYAASPAARLGHRLRARVIRDARRVIVCSRATAETAARRFHLPPDRVAVIPIAVADAFRSAGLDANHVAEVRARRSLPPRYLVFSGRYDARKDMPSLFAALKQIRARQPSGGALPAEPTQPGSLAWRESVPFVVFAVAPHSGGDAAHIERAVTRHGLTGMVAIVHASTAAELAAIVAGAEALVYPALSESTGLAALEALSVGVPVICSRAGALPESVASAGIVVAPGDNGRLAAAIEAIWDGGALAQQLRRQARRRAESWTWSWSDVARETRVVYQAAARHADSGGTGKARWSGSG